MAKQVFDSHPASGMTRDQSTEHLRNYKVIDPDMKKYGYYDPTRMRLDFEVIDGKITPIQKGYHIDKRLKDSLKQRGLKMPEPYRSKNGTLKPRRAIANLMLYGSRDRMRELAFGNQKVDYRRYTDNSHIQRKEDIEKWAVGLYNHVAARVGKENIIAFVVHLDEMNPHVHCTVTPVNDKGKFSYNEFFGGTKSEGKLKEWHDYIAEYNADWGLERGDDVRLTGAKHRTSEEYWTYLRDECSRLEKEVDGLNEQIKLVEDEIRRATIKHKSFTTMIANQEKVLEDLNNDVNSEEFMLQENQQKNSELMVLIIDHQRILKEKKEQLKETDEKLILLRQKYQELLQQKNDMEQQNREVRKQLNDTRQEELDRLETDLFSQFGRYLTYLPNMIGEQLEDLKNSMTFDQREKFDKMMSRTFLKEMTENYEDIIRTAASFYLGRPSQEAVEIVSPATSSISTVGGIGTHGGGWKKKPDEDDDAYKYRCVAMACMVAKRKRSLKR